MNLYIHALLPRENHQMDSIDRKIDEVAEYRFMNEKNNCYDEDYECR